MTETEEKKQVLFEPFPRQVEFLNAIFSGKYDVIMYGGSIRGGKTYAGLGAMLLLSKAFPRSRWTVVRDSLSTIKRNTIPSWSKIKPTNFIKKENQETMTTTFNNDSQLFFFAENYAEDKELDRWKGLETNGFLLEEINEMQEATFNKAIERSGSYIPAMNSKKAPSIIICTCNPSGGWVKRLFYDRWKDGTLPERWLYIPSKIFDNPYITQDTAYMEQLKQLPTYQYEKFVNGNWDIQEKTGGEYYKCFDMDKHIRTENYDPLLALHVSFDENVNPYLPCGIFQIDDRRVKMIDEICLPHPRNSVTEMCKDICRKYRTHCAGMFIYGDATSRKQDTKIEKGHNFFTLVQEGLKQFQPTLRITKSNPSPSMFANWINSVLEKELNGISVSIDRECMKAIQDLSMLKESPDGGIVKETEINPKTRVKFQKVGHISDLFKYFMVNAFPHEYAKYQHGGFSGKTRFIKAKGRNHW